MLGLDLDLPPSQIGSHPDLGTRAGGSDCQQTRCIVPKYSSLKQQQAVQSNKRIFKEVSILHQVVNLPIFPTHTSILAFTITRYHGK